MLMLSFLLYKPFNKISIFHQVYIYSKMHLFIINYLRNTFELKYQKLLGFSVAKIFVINYGSTLLSILVVLEPKSPFSAVMLV